MFFLLEVSLYFKSGQLGDVGQVNYSSFLLKENYFDIEINGWKKEMDK